jgi:uncharacterized protein (TIGR04255 family)
MENLVLNSPSAVIPPSYGNPPVNEVVCGMRFHPLDLFRIPHIGLLWDKFRQEYPNIQHASPIAGSKGEIPLDHVTGLPLPRVWFINKSDDQLIQFQSDRFYFNWRRRQDVYPRYPYVISHFENLMDAVADVFGELGLGNLRPTEYELSYINHIPKGREWNTIDDLSKIFSDFIWGFRRDRFLPSPENVAWQASFPLPEKKGVLAVNLKQAVRFEDKMPLFVFELTARGPSDSPDKNGIRRWFDLAHEWIVKGFTDLTSLVAQREYWKREGGG